GVMELYVKSTTGFGEDRLLLASDRNTFPTDWSSDGRFILFRQFAGNVSRRQLFALVLQKDAKPVPVQTTNFDDSDAGCSPDGQWLALVSNASGRNQIYIRSFPGEERKWQISSQGGLEPRWRGDGKELFYRALDGTLMAVPTNLNSGSDPGVPVALFQ